MSTLTERYVQAVLRAMPAGQRADLEPEIRALVADAVDAQPDAPSPELAERAALTELGDPDALAGRYVDRTRYLIGPRLYPDWLRVLGLVVPLVATIVTIVVGAATWLDGQNTGQVIMSAFSAGLSSAVQSGFWITVVFAILERTEGREALGPSRPWTPDDLPAAPATERMGIGDAVGSIVANVFVIGALVWLQVASPIVIDGVRYPLFDPALWSFWLPYFIVVAGLEIAFAIVLYLRGRWTWAMAVVNAALNLAFAVPALQLLQQQMLFNPELVAQLEETTGGAWFGPTGTIVAIAVIAIVAVDVIDGFRKAWHNERMATGTQAALG
ncbi:MAG TPA: hypothetical protein VFY23_11605 [Candidatus Limnocylindrales bacterium]|nr:hypothetical protein [Candidatus Limnocylindrales bacterium]